MPDLSLFVDCLLCMSSSLIFTSALYFVCISFRCIASHYTYSVQVNTKESSRDRTHDIGLT